METPPARTAPLVDLLHDIRHTPLDAMTPSQVAPVLRRVIPDDSDRSRIVDVVKFSSAV